LRQKNTQALTGYTTATTCSLRTSRSISSTFSISTFNS